MTIYHTTTYYRTNSGCNAKMLDIEARDGTEALDLAAAKVRRMRGVIRIDGGDCVAEARSSPTRGRRAE
jgi:hypothetical protein